MKEKVIVILMAILILAIVIIGVIINKNINSKSNNTNTLITKTSQENNGDNENIENNNDENKNIAVNNVNQSNSIDKNIPSSNKNILVLYFSLTEHTEKVAKTIYNKVGGDIIKLEPNKTYPTDYSEATKIAKAEQNENARPELKTKIDNIDKYDVIFLGYPIWWGDMPMFFYTFLDEYDLSGKTIIPFCTSGATGIADTPDKIQKEEPNAKVIKNGLSIYASSLDKTEENVDEWLNNIEY